VGCAGGAGWQDIEDCGTVLRALKVRVAILNDASVDGQPVKFVFKIRDYRIHVDSSDAQ